MPNDMSYSDTLLDSSSSTIYAVQSGQISTPDNLSTTTEVKIVNKDQLCSICSHICMQFQSIVNLLTDLANDVSEDNESSADLLLELQNKVQPFLENLDEEMTSSENLTRVNLDNSKINERRVEWLLIFHKFQLEMRRVLKELSGSVYEDIERVLTLRHRGCFGVTLRKNTNENLEQMKIGMERADHFIQQQRCNINDS